MRVHARIARGKGGFLGEVFSQFTPTLLIGLFLELDCPARRPDVPARRARGILRTAGASAERAVQARCG